MKKLVIIGGGFSGLWAAFSATRKAKLLNKDKVSITLINKDPYHGLRPRFYEADLSDTRITLDDWLKPMGTSFLMDEVVDINAKVNEIKLKTSSSANYDQLILATGSKLTTPDIPGLSEYSFNIDTFSAAEKLQKHISDLSNAKPSPGQFTIVVAGGGFTGIEAAADFMDRLKKIVPKIKKPRVIVIDRSQVASQFSAEIQNVIFESFQDMQIETLSNIEIEEIFKNKIKLSNGEVVHTNTLVWTAGIQSNDLTKNFQITLDHFGRLPVDRYLRVSGVDNCFAAGDVAAATTDGKHMALLSCQHAMPQGRFTGNNAIASMFNEKLLMYEQPKYVTCIDLGSWGALYAEGWDQKVISVKKEAKIIKIFINHDRIYPPSIKDCGISGLLEAADPVFKPIKL